jgi:hypothetical protein
MPFFAKADFFSADKFQYKAERCHITRKKETLKHPNNRSLNDHNRRQTRYRKAGSKHKQLVSTG